MVHNIKGSREIYGTYAIENAFQGLSGKIGVSGKLTASSTQLPFKVLFMLTLVISVVVLHKSILSFLSQFGNQSSTKMPSNALYLVGN